MINEYKKEVKNTKELHQMYEDNLLTVVYKWVPLKYAENLETDLKAARALSDGKDKALLDLAKNIAAFGKWLEQSRGDFMDDSGEAALMTIICAFEERLSPTHYQTKDNNLTKNEVKQNE